MNYTIDDKGTNKMVHIFYFSDFLLGGTQLPYH